MSYKHDQDIGGKLMRKEVEADNVSGSSVTVTGTVPIVVTSAGATLTVAGQTVGTIAGLIKVNIGGTDRYLYAYGAGPSA